MLLENYCKVIDIKTMDSMRETRRCVFKFGQRQLLSVGKRIWIWWLCLNENSTFCGCLYIDPRFCPTCARYVKSWVDYLSDIS